MIDRPELPRIQSVRVRAYPRLEIQWQHGETSTIDMSDIIAAGGVFDALRDRDFFAGVRIGDRGRTIEWVDPLRRDEVLADYDADSIMLLADQQKTVSGLQKVVSEIRALRTRIAHQPT